jgi:hypothetical protein
MSSPRILSEEVRRVLQHIHSVVVLRGRRIPLGPRQVSQVYGALPCRIAPEGDRGAFFEMETPTPEHGPQNTLHNQLCDHWGWSPGGLVKMVGIARWRRWFGCRMVDMRHRRDGEMFGNGFNGLREWTLCALSDNGTMETPKKETHF